MISAEAEGEGEARQGARLRLDNRCSYMASGGFKSLSNKDKEGKIRAQEEAGMDFSVKKMTRGKCH